MANHTVQQKTQHIYPLVPAHERLLIWGKARGLWKHGKGIEKKLRKLRKEWDRKLGTR